MGDLFDAVQMYDEDYLYFFAAPEGASDFAAHGPAVPGAGVPGEAAAELAWRLLELPPPDGGRRGPAVSRVQPPLAGVAVAVGV